MQFYSVETHGEYTYLKITTWIETPGMAIQSFQSSSQRRFSSLAKYIGQKFVIYILTYLAIGNLSSYF